MFYINKINLNRNYNMLYNRRLRRLINTSFIFENVHSRCNAT